MLWKSLLARFMSNKTKNSCSKGLTGAFSMHWFVCSQSLKKNGSEGFTLHIISYETYISFEKYHASLKPELLLLRELVNQQIRTVVGDGQILCRCCILFAQLFPLFHRLCFTISNTLQTLKLSLS